MCLTTLTAWALYIIAAVTLFCGITIMGVGASLASGISEYGEQILKHLVGDNLDGDTYFSAVYIMIPVGTLLAVSSFLGCWGSWRRKQFWLMLFNIISMVIIVMVLVSGILASVYKASYNEQGMEDSFTSQVNGEYKVPGNTDTTDAWDVMQNSLSCCGANGIADWNGSNFTDTTGDIVPWSCCTAYNGQDVASNDAEYMECKTAAGLTDPNIDIVHTSGCLDKFEEDVNTNSDVIMGVCFSLGLLNLIGVGLGCFLKGKLEDADIS